MKTVNEYFYEKVLAKIGECPEWSAVKAGIDRLLADHLCDGYQEKAEQRANFEFGRFSLMPAKMIKSHFVHYHFISGIEHIRSEAADLAQERAEKGTLISKETYRRLDGLFKENVDGLMDDQGLLSWSEGLSVMIYICLRYAVGMTSEVPAVIKSRIELKKQYDLKEVDR